MPSHEELRYQDLGPGSGNKEASAEVSLFVRDMTREATRRAILAIRDVVDLCGKAPDGSNRRVDVAAGTACSVAVSLLVQLMHDQPGLGGIKLAERVMRDIASFTLVGCSAEEATRRQNNEKQ